MAENVDQVGLRRRLLLAGLALPAIGRRVVAQEQPVPAPPRPVGPSVEDIRAILVERAGPGRDSLGYVAGIIDADDRQLLAVGQSGAPDGRGLDADSVFEIGSITKVFTALLLADMVQRGEVALDDPVERYLPPEGRPRAYQGHPMTLLDLATYTSGLPRMPSNFAPKDAANPYADYTVAQLYAFVSTYAPEYYPGSHYEYANLGFALLGHVLALRAGRSYEELVVARICDPLGMNDTRITLTPSMQRRLVPGHDTQLQPAANWDLPTFAGAGALRSTARDLFRFLAAARDPSSALAPAFARVLEVRRPLASPTDSVAAGWFVSVAHADELVWKDGGTGGYSSFIGYSTRSFRAAVLLSNAANYTPTLALGLHLLNSEYKLPRLRVPVSIEPAALAALAGRYALSPSFILTVTPRDGHLMVQATNQAEYEVFPESDTRFFYRVVDAQLTFHLGADGVASAVVLHQNGRNRRGQRMP